MASKKKPAIQLGHTQGIDDIANGIGKAINRYGAMRKTNHGVVESLSKTAKTKGDEFWGVMGDSYKSLKRAQKVSKKFDKNMKRNAK
jgi:hypothetical protein